MRSAYLLPVEPIVPANSQRQLVGPVARLGAAALQQVVGRVGHRERLVRQGFVLGEHALRGVEHALRFQLVQQRVALLQQALPGAAGVNQARGVGQHREHGALAPGEVVRAAPEVAPRGGLEADDISPEGGVGGV